MKFTIHLHLPDALVEDVGGLNEVTDVIGKALVQASNDRHGFIDITAEIKQAEANALIDKRDGRSR